MGTGHKELWHSMLCSFLNNSYHFIWVFLAADEHSADISQSKLAQPSQQWYLHFYSQFIQKFLLLIFQLLWWTFLSQLGSRLLDYLNMQWVNLIEVTHALILCFISFICASYMQNTSVHSFPKEKMTTEELSIPLFHPTLVLNTLKLHLHIWEVRLMYLWKEINNVQWNKVDFSEVCPDLTLVQISKQAKLSQVQAWLCLHRPRASRGDGTGSYSLWRCQAITLSWKTFAD